MINKTITDSSHAINTTTHLEPKIYMACFASHLEGKKHGVWVNANQSVEALKKAAQGMLGSSPAGAKAAHWAILKTEGFHPLVMDEFTPLVLISHLAAFLIEHGQLGAMLIHHFDEDVELATLKKAQRMMAQGYHGVHASPLAFVESFFPIPSPLSWCIEPYIFHQLIAKHLFISYFFTLKIRGQLHVFSRYKTLDQFENRPLDLFKGVPISMASLLFKKNEAVGEEQPC